MLAPGRPPQRPASDQPDGTEALWTRCASCCDATSRTRQSRSGKTESPIAAKQSNRNPLVDPSAMCAELPLRGWTGITADVSPLVLTSRTEHLNGLASALFDVE